MYLVVLNLVQRIMNKLKVVAGEKEKYGTIFAP
jgi:hypothetical protein